MKVSLRKGKTMKTSQILLSALFAFSTAQVSAETKMNGVVTVSESHNQVTHTTGFLVHEDSKLEATWTQSSEKVVGDIVLFHGFNGNPRLLSDLSEKISLKGFRVIIPKISFGDFNGGKRTVKKFTEMFKDTIKYPDSDKPFGERIIFMGYSAGGWIASGVAKNLVDKVDGILYLDPVDRFDIIKDTVPDLANQNFPILNVVEEKGMCNRNGAARPLFSVVPTAFKGIKINGGSHCDPLGKSADFICKLTCGAPKAKQVGILQNFVVNFLLSYTEKGNTYSSWLPGGEKYEEHISNNDIKAFTP